MGGQSRAIFYSKPVKMRLDPTAAARSRSPWTRRFRRSSRPKDTAQVKYLRVQNDRLTKFWGRPMHLGAIVLLPYGWDTHPNAHYPVADPPRPFPSSMAARRLARDAARPERERQRSATAADAAYQFYKDWNGPKFPRMIHVLVQHPTPYFDDSYAVNSANNGPYGDAITYDLLPLIEKQFRGIGQGWARVDDRRIDRRVGSVRRPGDVPRRLQRRVGALSRSDRFPVLSIGEHLRRAQRATTTKTIRGSATPKPGYRDYRDHLYSTFEDRNLVELVLGTHGRSGGQHDAWASVFGPVGDDGYYKPLYDKATGAIDPEVANVLARQLRPALHPAARLGDARPRSCAARSTSPAARWTTAI